MHKFEGVVFRKGGSRWRLTCLLTALALLVGMYASAGAAQTVTGQITGTVADPSGAVVAGAKVTLTYTLTGQQREVVTDSSGVFVFPELVPGTYNVAITATGFQPYNQTGVVVGASERVALHELQLSVGNVSTEITVTANEAHVQTDSSEHAGLLTDTQYENVPDRGRNYLDFLRLLPGVTASGTGTDAPGWGSGAVTFNGGNGQVVMQLDGVTSMDTGQGSATGYISPSVDAIQEVRVQTGNVDAEYGSRAGGTVNVVIKNGTPQFHGSAYEFLRNNFFNANTYFSKLSTNPKIADHPAPYKFNNFGGTIGGPVIIPGVGFNKNRDKLFFFFSGDYIRRNETTIGSASGPSTMTTPTPAERAGMFYGLSSALKNLPIGSVCTTYGTGLNACTLPGSAVSAAGDKFLTMLPQPSCRRTIDADPALPAAIVAANSSINSLPLCGGNSFNYNALITTPHPWNNDILRVDYNLSKTELWYVRLIKNFEQYNFGFLGGSGNWPQLINLYTIHSSGAVSTLVSTLRPNLVNEFTAGTNRALQTVDATPTQLGKNQRAPNGLGPTVLPVLFPSGGAGTGQKAGVNPFDLIPNVTFGGSSVGPDTNNAPNYVLDASNRYPFFGTDTTYNVTDNLSWVKGNHNMKFGFYFEKTSRNTQRASQFHGALNFAVTPTNPIDTGDSFSNAYLGVFQTYTESDFRPVGHGRYHQIEWFGQDNWKATRRLTLDYGVRFQLIFPDTVANQTVSAFVPTGVTTAGGIGSTYNAGAQPALIRPCLNGGARVGCESNGAFVPAGTIGLFDPTSAGTPYQGMVKYTNGSVINTPPLEVGPRVGFAYDVFGNGKTAVRGGFGIFYDRNQPTDGQIFVFLEGPPLINTPTVFNSTISNISGGFIGPAAVNGSVQNNRSPVTYQYNLGVQRDMGHGILLDVSYVGNQLRHSLENLGYNTLPYGMRFRPTSQDVTKAGSALPDVFLEPNPGYQGINYSTYGGSSNYNSLQTTVIKRFGRRLTLGGAWTWSHELSYNIPGSFNYSLGIPARAFYGPTGNDRRQNVKINWTYNLPNGPFQNAFAKEAINGWTVTGVATFISGAPGTIGLTLPSDYSGTGAPTRPNLTGQPVVVRGSAVAGLGPAYLSAAAFTAPNGRPVASGGTCNPAAATPATCGFGNAGQDYYFGPGTNNWDISLFKNFQLGSKESRYLQFRLETYNTFNHTEFSGISTGTSFNAGGTITNAGNGPFGRLNATNPARIIVLALKLEF